MAVFEQCVQGRYTSQMPIILIGTDKTESLIDPEWLNEHRIQLQMPLKFKQVKKALRKLLNVGPESDATSSLPVA